MPAAPHLDDDQRRARLSTRHLLAPHARTDDPTEVARALVALHSSDPATVHLAVAARACDADIPRVEQALYDDRSVVRMLGMRRTLFVVPADVAPVVQAACTDDVAARERQRLVRFMEADGIDDAESLLTGLEQETLDALVARGGAATTELSEAVPGLQREITVGSGRWRTAVKLSSRVLFLLAAQGRIVRGRPRGTWLSSQYRWATTAAWLGDDGSPAPATDEARAALARSWLWTFGPGTVEDVKWWTGWNLTQTRRVLGGLATTEVTLDDGGTGLVLADDTDAVADPGPAAALLPALDPTPMGWTGRDWYLGPHRDDLFDRNGNVGPTVWWRGRIVGGWAQQPDGGVVVELLTDIGRDGRAAVDAEAARLDALLGDVRVTPRFRTPLERRLAA